MSECLIPLNLYLCVRMYLCLCACVCVKYTVYVCVCLYLSSVAPFSGVPITNLCAPQMQNTAAVAATRAYSTYSWKQEQDLNLLKGLFRKTNVDNSLKLG